MIKINHFDYKSWPMSIISITLIQIIWAYKLVNEKNITIIIIVNSIEIVKRSEDSQ